MEMQKGRAGMIEGHMTERKEDCRQVWTRMDAETAAELLEL